MPESPFYLTTTLPYVNADPHVGFAMEIVRADAIARYKTQEGYDVFFNTGTDEHGLKIYQKALAEDKDLQAYVDDYASRFKNLHSVLGLSDTIHFIRTTDAHHISAAQEFWKRCEANGYIYKKKYRGLYCVGDELFVTEKDLVGGKCPNHPDQEPVVMEEENYFFKWSAFRKPLLDFYEAHPDFVVPDSRYNEIKAFVGRGLEDFSISRLREKMPWGIEVPGDPDHVMYVWFDALVNYISTLGWPEDEKTFSRFWTEGTPTQYAGKDNLRQQAAMWQAMLMAAGLPPSHRIVIDGFITSGGQKMSKSIGNVVNPVAVVDEYGTDALRYFLLRHMPPFEDGDFTMEAFKDTYNANLANGLGNFSARVMKMSSSYGVSFTYEDIVKRIAAETEGEEYRPYRDAFEHFQLNSACDFIWKLIQTADEKIQNTQPFKLIKTDREKALADVGELVVDLYRVAYLLRPLLPGTSSAIMDAIKHNVMPPSLFPRQD